MSKTIWKFRLSPFRSDVEMPSGASILDVREQGDDVCLWALVDPSEPIETRKFSVYGTGHTLPPNAGTYVGTAHLGAGVFVFHVFEDAADA